MSFSNVPDAENPTRGDSTFAFEFCGKDPRTGDVRIMLTGEGQWPVSPRVEVGGVPDENTVPEGFDASPPPAPEMEPQETPRDFRVDPSTSPID